MGGGEEYGWREWIEEDRGLRRRKGRKGLATTRVEDGWFTFGDGT